MNWTDRGAFTFSGELLHPGSVYDPISAHIAEDLGFELGMFTGSTACSPC